MKMDIVSGSGNDDFYTPKYAITPILKYIKKEQATIIKHKVGNQI